MKVFYGVSPIGLGHAARAVAVGAELKALGHEVRFASSGNALGFLRSYGFDASDGVDAPVPRVVGGEMKGASGWYISYWRRYRATKRRVAAMVSSLRPDVLVGDEEFATAQLSVELGVPGALVADELELGFARGALARALERRVSRWYQSLQSKVELLMVPDSGRDEGNRRFVGPIVRRPTAGRAETRKENSLPEAGTMVLFSMSGSGVGSYFLDAAVAGFREAAVPGAYLAISGNRGERIVGDGLFDLGVVRDNQDLVASADLVISTAGKSTIDEAASAGTPIIALPIRGHAEQERNAAALGYRFDDVRRLSELIGQKAGAREKPRSYDGAAVAAKLLVGLHASAGGA